MLSVVGNVSTLILTVLSVLGFGIKLLKRVSDIVSTLERLVVTVKGHADTLERFEKRLKEVEKAVGNGPPS